MRYTTLQAAVSVAALASGCAAFTREAGLQRVRDEMQQEQAERARAEHEALRKKLEADHAALDIKYKRIEKRNELLQRRYDAQVALQGGDAARAVELLATVFADIEAYEASPDAARASPEDGQLIEPKELAKFRTDEGIALFQLGKKEEAIAALRKALELDPDYGHGRRTLGKVLLMLERLPEALEVYQGELVKGIRDAELLFPVGQALYVLGQKENDAGKIEAARVALQAVLVEKPADPEVRRWLARLEYDTARYDEAARLFEALRRENPLQTEYLEYLANCYVKLKDYKKAADYLELVARVSRRPTAESCRTLGDLYAAMGLSGRAAEWHSRAAGGDPARAPAADRLAIGQLFQESGRNEDALRWLESVEPTDKEYGEAQSILASLYHDLGRMDDALAAFQKVNQTRPQDGFAFLSAGDIQRQRRKYDLAAEAYSRASALPDTRADGFFGLGEVLYDQGKLDDAARYYEKAMESAPGVARYESVLRQVREEIALRSTESEAGAGG